MAGKLEELKFRHPINRPYRVTSIFMDPRRDDRHWGEDEAPLPGNEDTIHAINTGRILREGWHPMSGWFFWAEVDYIDGRKYWVLCAHMQSRCPLRAGDTFDVGQWLGNIGSTGNSTGEHVHIEIRDDRGFKRDPGLWLENVRLVSLSRRLHNQIIEMGGEPNV